MGQGKQNHTKGSIIWEQIRDDYVCSTITYSDLSKKYNIAKRVIERKGSAEGWVKQRKEFNEQKSISVHENILNQSIKQIIDLKTHEIELYSNVEHIIKSLVGVVDIETGEWSIRADLEPIEVATFVQSLERLQKMRYKTLGIVDKIEISTLKTMLDSDRENQIDNTIKINESMSNQDQIEAVANILLQCKSTIDDIQTH
jgi:hypothetical protein